MSSKKPTIEEHFKKYLAEDEKLLKKYDIVRSPVINFPQDKVPPLARLAVRIIQLYGGRNDIRLLHNPKK